MKNNVKLLTRSAMLLALTIVFQAMGRYLVPYLGSNNNFVVGSLVNACLLIAAAFTGLWSGVAIAVIAPFGAILTGASIPVMFAPFIAIGNSIIVIVFYLLMKKNIWAALITGSVIKFAFLYAAIVVFLRMVELKPKMEAALLLSFSWPQLVTALVGGLIAIIIMKPLKAYVKE